jgi:hypothetical protein
MCSALSLWFTKDLFFESTLTPASLLCVLNSSLARYLKPAHFAYTCIRLHQALKTSGTVLGSRQFLESLTQDQPTKYGVVVGMACCLHALEQIGLEKYACMDRRGTLVRIGRCF